MAYPRQAQRFNPGRIDDCYCLAKVPRAQVLKNSARPLHPVVDEASSTHVISVRLRAHEVVGVILIPEMTGSDSVRLVCQVGAIGGSLPYIPFCTCFLNCN